MSSTGTISNVFSASISSHSESQRKISNAVGSIPGPHEQNKRATGVIVKVHPTKPHLIKANALDTTPLANGDWIELNHSAQEIVERWGTVRVGFRVRVSFIGPSGSGADATIIGAEQQVIDEPHQPNEAARGLFSIFAPGIGI